MVEGREVAQAGGGHGGSNLKDDRGEHEVHRVAHIIWNLNLFKL